MTSCKVNSFVTGIVMNDVVFAPSNIINREFIHISREHGSRLREGCRLGMRWPVIWR